MLHSTAVAQEQPPLLSRGEILEILRETDNKKAIAPLSLSSTSTLLPRILKFSAVGLSAAAVLAVFMWRTGSEHSPNPPAATYSQHTEPQENTPPPASVLQQKTIEQPLHAPNTDSQHKEVTTPTIARAEEQRQSETAIASGRASAPPAIMAMADESSANKADNAGNDDALSAGSDIKAVTILTPERIEPILGKRIHDVETALGINFGTPPASASPRSADTPMSNSLTRSFTPETNSFLPKPSSLAESKRSGSYSSTDANHKTDGKSLLGTLREASVNPQMVTLIQDGKIVANEWNFGTPFNVKADELLPVYVSLRGKEIAEGKADYALLWLPPSSSTTAQSNSINLIVTPNPAEDNHARLTLTAPEEMMISIALYDIFGKKIQDVVVSEKIGKGQFNREFALENLSDGVYTAFVIGTGNKELASYRFVVEKVREK